jgi:hypothetical protein
MKIKKMLTFFSVLFALVQTSQARVEIENTKALEEFEGQIALNTVRRSKTF